MAKPDEEEFAPRKTTTYNKFEGMASQNERYNVKANENFWLENIMRTAPHKLSSVPGPSLVAEFSTRIPFIGSCAACLVFDPPTSFIVATSALSNAPCFCIYQLQLCIKDDQFSQAVFRGIVSGHPRSGPAVRVLSTSTPTSFTGYGLIYDPGAATQKLSIVKWVAASLATMGTVLSSQNTTLVPGDVLTLNAQTVGGANRLHAYINNVMQNSMTVSDSDISTSNSGSDFIVVGNTGVSDKSRWNLLTFSCIDPPQIISPPPLDCAGSQSVVFTVIDGEPPYSWSTTKGSIAESGVNHETATLTPPANSGSGVPGVAYARSIQFGFTWGDCPPSGCKTGGGAGCTILGDGRTRTFGCNDNILDSCGAYNGDPATCINGSCPELVGFGPCSNNTVFKIGEDACPRVSEGVLTDKRTPSMISAGCNPCELSMAGGVVTVTDFSGISVSVPIVTL